VWRCLRGFIKSLGAYSDDGRRPLFFLFLVPLCTVSLLAISLVPSQGLKRARVFMFMSETVVGRPTGMFIVIKIGGGVSAREDR
jgi:hypothetical protein